MMRQLLSTVLLLFCLGMQAASDLIPDMKFRRLDTRDGLSNSQVNCIFQDSKGYIWIGTSYGLNRYDGYRFRTYYSDVSDTTTLRNNYVDQIFEDWEGRLWLRQGMNYSIFDPVTERVNRNPATELAKLGIKGSVDRIYIDSKKNIWVKIYDEGIYCYNPKTKQKTFAKQGYARDEIEPEFYISSFAESSDRLLLASSDGDLIALDNETGGVVWKDSYMRKNGGHSQDSYTIKVDSFSNYWVITNSNVFIYHKKSRTWYNSINSFLESKGIEKLPENLMVWDILMDQRHWMWIATDHEGLIIVNPKTLEVKQFLNNKLDQSTLSENTVKHFLLDKDGNMWISAYRNGVNQYIEKPSGFETLELGDINTTTEDRYGNYWLGTDNRGIIKYNPRTGESQFYDKANTGFASDIMVASYTAKDGTLWFGTYNGGLIHLGADGRLIKNYTASNEPGALLNNNVWSVTQDKWGDIWIGTLGNGVQRLVKSTDKFRTWSSYNTPLKENFMTSVNWVKEGWLMAGHSQFYSLINPVTGKVLNFTIPAGTGQQVPAASSTCVMEDSRGLIWQGSTAGCCIYNRKNGQVTLLDMNSGLRGSSVVGIAEDHQHTMWVVTEHGISNITPQQEEDGTWTFLVRSFSSSDGLQQGPYNQRSISCTSKGLILVGGLEGVDVINPKLVSNIGNQEIPLFSGLKLFGQQMGVGQEYDGRVILKEALADGGRLELRYYENQFTIQLATNKGEVHNPSRFIYQLEGFSDKWIKTEESDPNITYMSLKHGSYILHVRMLNDNGTMGEHEATLEIVITPPLWRTRWMMLLYMLLVLAAGWYWRKRFLQRHAEKVELEKIRTEVQKKQWMNEVRAQLMAETGQKDAKPQGRAEPMATDVEAVGDSAAQAPVSELSEPLQMEPAELISFVKANCDSFKAPEGKNLRLQFVPLAKETPVRINRVQLSRAINILLENAVMFSPSDCRVKVFVDQMDGKASIRISDNGIGIPPEAKEHMFDPMVGEEDTGISLHVVQQIVNAHHGTVKGDDNPGGGSVFTITLPVDDIPVEEAVLMDDDEEITPVE